MTKIKFLTLLIVATILGATYSCTTEDQNTQDDLSLNDISFDINIDMTTTLKREGTDIDALLSDIVDELYNTELSEVNALAYRVDSNTQEQPYIEFQVLINKDNITITPIEGTEPVNPDGDNEDCGGRKGDGWKLYGSCMSESCVKKKAEKATAELKDGLGTGKCLDIRVKRNALNAKVCGRIIKY
ncbi:hypothetical protein [Lacinutrix undariae]